MKLIKFDLPIDGVKVRNIEELLDHFNTEILDLHKSGLLAKWLRSQRQPDLQAQVESIAKNSSDQARLDALCCIFSIDLDSKMQQKFVLHYAKQKAKEFAEHLKEAYTRKFVFLLVGRTGVGKSSIINELIGGNVAPIGDFEPQTMTVEEYKLPIENVNFTVIDTPGLYNDFHDIELEYIKKIKQKVKHIDNILYVSPLNDTRIRSDEIRGIETITKAFGEKIWENSVIVFTFADAVLPEKYNDKVTERSQLMNRTIQNSLNRKMTGEIPSVTISNYSKKTGKINEWLGEFYFGLLKKHS